ncbi:MAG: DUF3798 domain-containing protein [Firmicutes bacterium]|nr:DUF3798 domain-containing protein [Bacillota bacterium]
MKRLNIVVLLSIAVLLVSCAKDNTSNQPITEISPIIEIEEHTNSYHPTDEIPKLPFEGKIAIITDESPYFYTAVPITKKYGGDKVFHKFWLYSNLITEENPSEGVVHLLIQFGADPNIKAVVVNAVCPGVIADFKILRESRADIFVIYCEPPYGDAATLSSIADFVICTDESSTGSAMAQQAKKLGAETLVFYSNPQYSYSSPVHFVWRDQIQQQCNELGIQFIDVIIPKRTLDSDDAVIDFINTDVPNKVEKYGKDTAFFATDCFMQIPLVQAIIENGAIYPQPCCFSSANAISAALGQKTDMDYFIEINSHFTELSNFSDAYKEGQAFIAKKDKPVIIKTWAEGTKAALAEKGMMGRLSTWPVDNIFMYAYASSEYAIKWINGEVPQEGVDVEVLKQLMEDYAGVEVYLTPYTDEESGETYENFLLMRMDYITF